MDDRHFGAYKKSEAQEIAQGIPLVFFFRADRPHRLDRDRSKLPRRGGLLGKKPEPNIPEEPAHDNVRKKAEQTAAEDRA